MSSPFQLMRLPDHLRHRYRREEVVTSDGWRLVAHRITPHQQVTEIPVVLVHGHGTGAWSYMGATGGGLAGALAEVGRDVWAVELRGSTGTRRPARRSAVRISDKLGIDLVSLLGHIRERTESPVVDAVGHSMGGILLCLGDLTQSDWPVRRAVTLGSPLALASDAIPRALLSSAARRLASRLGRLRLSRLATVLSGRLQATWMPTQFHPDNVEEATFRAFLRWGISDVYGAELSELIRWVDHADHRELLPRGTALRSQCLTVPTRFLVGSQDPLTSPAAVRRTFEAIAGPDCEYREVGRATGFARDYRHLDMLLGGAAQHEVSPLIVDWLGRGIRARASLSRAACAA